jgi:hypothetical protein
MKHCFNYTLAKKLCDWVYGSGLDTEPAIENMPDGRRIKIAWEYHLMNDQGYYCGYWRFILKIPIDNPMGFTLNGRAGNPQGKSACGIKEFLGDIFAGIMPEILQEGGIACELVQEKVYPGDPGYNPDLLFAREHGYHFGGNTEYRYSGELAGE